MDNISDNPSQNPVGEVDGQRYWVNETGLDLADEVTRRVKYWFGHIKNSLAFGRWVQGWRVYSGLPDASSPFDVSQLGFLGAESEIVTAKANHVGALGRNAVQIVTQTRPEMEPVSTNTDYASLAQTEVSKGILDYEHKRENGEEKLTVLNEIAIACGMAWDFTTWDPSFGPVYDVDQATGTELHEGKIILKTYMPWNVVVDMHRQDADYEWTIQVDWLNKWDLAAQYPELASDIIGIRDMVKQWSSSTEQSGNKGEVENDFIPVFTLHHAKTKSVPDGRWAIVLSSELILAEGPLPYEDLPGQMHSAGKLLNTPFGDSPLSHCLGLQDLLNQLISALGSNNINLARQSIIAPKGAGYSRSEIAEGLAWIEVDVGADGQMPMPQALQLVKSAPETYEFVKFLIQNLSTIMGQNAVVTGQDPAAIKDLSGSAMVMLESQALRFLSGLMASNARMIEGRGTRMVRILQRYAKSPRIARIAGKSKQYMLKEFTGKDLEGIDRVEVQQGNPGMRTPAYRLQLAEQLAQHFPNSITKEDYISVQETGSLQSAIEPTETERLNVQKENELMRSGQSPQALQSDNPVNHIKGALSVLDDPDARINPQVVNAVLGHVQQHLAVWRGADPALLQLLGYPPPPPPPMPLGMPPPGPPGLPPGPQMGPPPPHGPLPPPGLMAPPNPLGHPQAHPPMPPKNPMNGQRPPLPPGSSAAP